MPLLKPLASKYSVSNNIQRGMIRYITYLHSGSRIRGMKRDPSSYMSNPYGLEYESVEKDNNFQDNVRTILNLSKFNINLSNGLILQCLTHKSFAHGKMPYNEKLNILGSHFLKLHASKFSISHNQILPNDNNIHNIKSNLSINGFNFDQLGSLQNKNIVSDLNISKFIIKNGLHKLVFWKKRNKEANSTFNGEPKILTSVLNSFIGACLLTNGTEKTTKFVDDFLFDKGNNLSLVNLAKSGK